MAIVESRVRLIPGQLDGHSLEAFSRRFSGVLLRPGSAGYDAARAVWNGMVVRHPALIAYCASRQDVVERSPSPGPPASSLPSAAAATTSRAHRSATAAS